MKTRPLVPVISRLLYLPASIVFLSLAGYQSLAQVLNESTPGALTIKFSGELSAQVHKPLSTKEHVREQEFGNPPHIVLGGQLIFTDEITSASLTITNSGESPLYYSIDSHSLFRSFHGSPVTPPNSAVVSPGPTNIDAIPNAAGISLRSSFYGRNWDDCFYCNYPDEDGWQLDSNWQFVAPFQYSTYLRGKSNGSNVPSTVFLPRLTEGSESVSSFSTIVNTSFSNGSTWQIIPQSLTYGKIVTRLQINPDQTLQVLVSNGAEPPSFQQIMAELPKGDFKLGIEVDKNTSVFSVFINDARLFTGNGFAAQLDQVALLSLNESDESVLVLHAVREDAGVPLILTYAEDDYGDYLIDINEYYGLQRVTGTVEPGATIDREITFNISDLVPGMYYDSLRITSNDPTQPTLYVPVSALVERPYQPRPEYIAPGKIIVTHGAFPTSMVEGDSVAVKLHLQNTGPLEHTLYYPHDVPYDYDYRAYMAGPGNFHWTDIAATGIPLSLGDDEYITVEMPFVFPYGTVGSEFITIGSNGNLAIGQVAVDNPNNVCLFDYYPYEQTNMIAPYWDDLWPDAQSSIQYTVDSQKLIVQYTDVLVSGTDKRNTFQVILYRNGGIKFHYLDIHDLQSATVGLAFPSGARPINLGCNQPLLKDSLTIMFEYAKVQTWTDGAYYKYTMYPWIHYPGESVSAPPFETREVEVIIKADLPGEAYGNMYLWSHPVFDIGEPGWDQVDGQAFIFPVSFSVVTNAPPHLSPLTTTIFSADVETSLMINATDANDSTVTISVYNAPSFISLQQTGSTSATYLFSPTIADIGEHSMIVQAIDPHGAADSDTLYFSVIPAAVESFSMINLVTGEVLFDFTDSATVSRGDVNFARLAIRANILPVEIGSVKFRVDGVQTNIDNTDPYLLKKGVLQNLPLGVHTISAEPFSEASGHGQRGSSRQAVIKVIGEAYVVIDFSLMDKSTGKVLMNFDRDVSISRSRYNFDDLVIRANISPATVGSVKFKVNGSYRNIDNRSPFMLAAGLLQSLPVGTHVLSAQPFERNAAHGIPGTEKQVVVTIEDAIYSIVDFSLINFRTGEVIQNFNDKLVLNHTRADINDLTIRVNMGAENPGSVKFRMNGDQTNIDNANPYLLRQHALSSLMVGAHIFSAAPFANPNGKGQAGAWKEVFILIRGPRPSQIAEAKSTVVTETDALIDEGNQEVGAIYPNPVDKILNITLSPNDELYMIRIINTSGQLVFSKSVSARTGLPIEIDTTGIGLKAGVYYVQLVNLKGHCFTRKIVKA